MENSPPGIQTIPGAEPDGGAAFATLGWKTALADEADGVADGAVRDRATIVPPTPLAMASTAMPPSHDHARVAGAVRSEPCGLSLNLVRCGYSKDISVGFELDVRRADPLIPRMFGHWRPKQCSERIATASQRVLDRVPRSALKVFSLSILPMANKDGVARGGTRFNLQFHDYFVRVKP